MNLSRFLFLTALVAGLGACSGAADSDPNVSAQGILVGTAGAGVRLQPYTRVDGTWHGGGQDGACTPSGSDVRCPAGDVGTVVARLSGHIVIAWVELARDATVDVVELRGPATISGATTWLSNGFQSWSQAGALAIGAPPTEVALDAALHARGDAEVIRKGSELSWWYSAIGGGDSSLVAGVVSVSRWKSWVRYDRGAAGDGLRLVAGGTGESIAAKKGAMVGGEPWFVDVGADLGKLIDAYGGELRARARPLRMAESGWNSWYQLWDGVDASAVLDNAALATKRLGSGFARVGLPRIVVDDGWQQRWGEWQPNAKFPTGLAGLASTLHDRPVRMGVWLAPLLVDEKSELYTQHPDWFVQDAVYMHLKNGNMRVLDVTHPAAAAHLSGVIGQLVAWGYDLLKIDFLFAGTWEGKRFAAVTGMEAYNIALDLIRKAAGPGTTLLAVGAPPLPTLRYVESWRSGTDIAVETFGPSWPFLPNQLRSLAAHLPFCQAMLCDADPLLQRDLPRNEVEFSAWTVALAGGGLFLSDDQRALPEERATWGLDPAIVAAALGAQVSKPQPFFPKDPPETLANPVFDHLAGESHQVVPTHWRLPSGKEVVLNPSDVTVTTDDGPLGPHSAHLLP